MKTYTLKPRASMAAKGRFKVQVVQDGKVVQDYPWQRNLILDVGLNRLSQTMWADLFVRACAGTGTAPTHDDSGSVTASQSGTTVTLSESFGAVSAGRLIRWDSGEEAMIVSGSDTSWTVDRSQTVASDEFTIYRVNQTKLDTWVKNTETYLAGAGNCGTTASSEAGTLTHRRTYEFFPESSGVNYSEVGVTWETFATANPDLFSRVLFEGGAVTVLAGQQLRLVYDLVVTCSPRTPQAITADISGWPVAPSDSLAATQQWQLVGLTGVSTSGLSGSAISGGEQGHRAMEPSIAGFSQNSGRAVGISPSSASFDPIFSRGPNRTTNASGVGQGALDAYVPGSFERVINASFPPATGNRSDYRFLGFGKLDNSSIAVNDALNATTFGVLFDQSQTKDDEHRLNVRFKLTWGRDLS